MCRSNGGLGNHRYPLGFSGDTVQHEATLGFLIQATPLASNVLFPYWSHGAYHSSCCGVAPQAMLLISHALAVDP